jgi:hypothetical protein
MTRCELFNRISCAPASQGLDMLARLARRLGFARAGPVIDRTVLSLLRALVRKGDMTAQGRGTATLYCKT